jgi:RNA polymerase sigma-70 factor, ECF subfamily
MSVNNQQVVSAADGADIAAIRSFVGGDRGALEGLFKRNLDFMYRLARSRLSGAAEADDVVQESVLAVMAGAAKFAGGDMRAWLATIVLNTARNWKISSVRRQRREAVTVPTPPTTPNVGLDAEQRRILLSALDELPEKLRIAMHLHYVEEMPLLAVANATGVPLRTTQSRVRLGLARLSVLLGRFGSVLSANTIAAVLATLSLQEAPAEIYQRLPVLLSSPVKAPQIAKSRKFSRVLLTTAALGGICALILYSSQHRRQDGKTEVSQPLPRGVNSTAAAEAGLIAIPPMPQQNAEQVDLKLNYELMTLDKEYLAANEAGNYESALDFLRRERALIPQGQEVLYGVFRIEYNLACLECRQGRSQAALKALTNAAQYGWDDIDHTLSDEDLAPLREDERFKALVEAMSRLKKL